MESLVEVLLKLFTVSVVILISQTSYNAIVYRQAGYIRWIKFTLILIATTGVGYLLVMQIDEINKIPYLGRGILIIDSIFSAFYQYLPKKFIFYWLVVPFIIICLFFAVLTVVKSIEIRKNFILWEKRNKKIVDNEIQLNQSKKESDSIQEIRNTEIQDAVINDDNVQEIIETVHFLEEETTRIKYDSILGLRKVFEKSKQKGLQLDETEEGYVAIYSNRDGYISLKHLLESNGLSSGDLVAQPSIVLFNKKTINQKTIKEALEILNRGERLG